MIATILATLGSTLIGKGCSFFSDLVSSATDTGLEKVQEFIEEKTGIPLVTSDGEAKQLTEEQINEILNTVNEHRVELEKLSVQKMMIEVEDRADARAAQSHTEDTMLQAAQIGNDRVIDAAISSQLFRQRLALMFFTYSFLYSVFATVVPEAYMNTNAIMQILPSQQNIQLIMIGFYFGGALSPSDGSIHTPAKSRTPVTPTSTLSWKDRIKMKP